MQAPLDENYEKMMRESLKAYYQDKWDEMKVYKRKYLSGFLGEDSRYRNYLEEVLSSVPNSWEFEESGSKTLSYVSPATLDNTIEGLAKDDSGTEGIDVPMKGYRGEEHHTNLSHFLHSLDELMEDEIEQVFKSQYDVSDLEQEHLEAIKQIAE